MYASRFVLCAVLVAVVKAEDPNFLERGLCREGIQPLTAFDRTQFSGRWYRIGGIRNPDEEREVKCTTHDYSSNAGGMALNSQGLDARDTFIDRHTVLSMKDYTIAEFGLTSNRRPVQMQILTADYSSYACMVSCTNVVGTHNALFAWILSREPVFDKNVIGICQISMKEAGVPVAKLKGTIHGDNCTYTTPPSV